MRRKLSLRACSKIMEMGRQISKDYITYLDGAVCFNDMYHSYLELDLCLELQLGWLGNGYTVFWKYCVVSFGSSDSSADMI